MGSKLYSDLKREKDFEVFGTYRRDILFQGLKKMDVTNADEVRMVINEVHPDVIIHVAANPSSSWCEKNKEEAIRVNRDGTKNVVAAAAEAGADIIYMSSAAAAKQPVNVYGLTKRDSEQIVMNSTGKYLILKPSLVIGASPNTTNDRPFNRILKNLREGVPAVYDVSWKFQPTYLRHISEVAVQCINRSIWGKTIPIIVPVLKTRFNIAYDVLSRFNIAVEGVDNHDASPVVELSEDVLRELNLPTYSYGAFIDSVVNEIKETR